MARAEERRADFETALGESFGDCVCPPVPFKDASPHECCEVVWSVVGFGMTPTRLAGLSGPQVAALALRFGAYFECEPPSEAQVRHAIAQTLSRWPIGSLDEDVGAS